MSDISAFPQIAVSVAARNPETGEFLLVRRGRPPAQGLWAFPGGRVDFGERLEAAARRELAEETGLSATGISVHTMMELIGEEGSDAPPRHHYILVVHKGLATGTPRAGDDAAEAGWFDVEAMARLDITASTLAVAREIAAGDAAGG